MQNWQHVVAVVQHLNRKPTKLSADTDYSRIKSYVLDGHSSKRRQTILCSQLLFADMRSLQTNYCHNVSGRVAIRNTQYPGSVLDVRVEGMHQSFIRVPKCDSHLIVDDQRIDYVTTTLLQSIKNTRGLLIVTSSHHEYLRLRNWLQ